MAKKTEVVKNINTKKKTATTGEKAVVKTAQVKASATRKPAATAKPPAKPGIRKTVSKKPPQDEGNNCTVYGTVVYEDASPVDGLTIIAYDKDVSGDDDLGKAVVKAGRFEINYRDIDFRRTKEERGGADVIVCVYNAENKLVFTSKKKNNAPAEYELNIKLPAEQFMVSGTVTDANHKPLANLTVRALERDLRHPQLIGTNETGPNGEFRIVYQPADFVLGDVPARRAPWLIVEVLESPDGKVLSSQEVQKAARDQTVSFTLASIGMVTEKQRTDEAVSPLLKGQGDEQVVKASRSSAGDKRADLAPYDITPADVGFIVTETGLDRAAVEAWAASSRMARDAVSRLSDEYAAEQSLLGEHGWSFFYGLARQGLASDLDSALRASPSGWEKAWKAAQSAYRVPALNEKQITSLLDVMQLLQRLQQVDPQRGEKSDLAKVLAGLSQPLPKVIALEALAIFQDKGLDYPDALLVLSERHPQATAPIQSFVRAVRVHQLASGHEGLSRALNARLEGGVSDSIAPLAAMMTADWINVANDTSTNPGQALRMLAHVETQHPLTALQAKFIDGNVSLPGVSGGEMAALIKNEGVTVAAILQGKKRVKDTDTNVPAMHKTLRDVGRFMRSGLSMELAADLINADIGTPGKALRYGREFIYEQYRKRLPKDTAREVADGFIHATELHVNGGKGAMLDVGINRTYPRWMMEEYELPLPEEARENLPSLPGFFGDLDECICRPCESMLGQPAYLVDLLNLLNKVNGAYEELDARRPDIPELKLDCENSETLIQHIDIVLAILEKATAQTAANTPQDAIQDIAYGKLAGAVFPWNLPFDLSYVQLKAYLAKLGVSRSNLLSLQVASTSEQLVVETLSISTRQTAVGGIAISEWKLLTEQRRGADLWAAYGFRQASGLTIIDPASREQLENKTVQGLLKRVSVLLDRTGLTLDELEQVLETKFINGDGATLVLTNRAQCKTSEMEFPGTGATLEAYLDRLHRFVRLRTKFPDWSIEQLGKAMLVCGGNEAEAIDDVRRGEVVVKLTRVKRLCANYGLPLDMLLRQPLEELYLRKALGLSVQQFSLLKTITASDFSVQPQDFVALENFCQTAQGIADSGLSIEQVAEALLTRDQLTSLLPTLPPSIKTDQQIETLLHEIQTRLRAVAAEKSVFTGESQITAALPQFFDKPTIVKLVNAIRAAGARNPVAPSAPLLAELLPLLTSSPAPTSGLGEWQPLLTSTQATSILTVTTPVNLDAVARFEVLWNGIAQSRLAHDLQRILLETVAEQCNQPEPEVSLLLSSRLLLDQAQGQYEHAYKEFVDPGFWKGNTPPALTQTAMPRLHAWMDRLYRLISLSTSFGLDSALMRIADRAIMVGGATGINWRDLLAAPPPANGDMWSNPNWQALLDLVWLQKPEQLSRPVLTELLDRLAALTATPTQAEREEAVRPLALRLELSNTETLAIAAQAIVTVSASTLRDPSALRKVFTLLLLARHMRASAVQLSQLANLADNAQAADTTMQLLQARLSEQNLSEKALNEVMRKIEDPLRQQKRDALVAYLLRIENNDKLRNANDLYEHYLIDPQMEPCFDTTRIVEAITATQLFMQRILFGLEEGITASDDLKNQWTWMRNYRVWEANRKVFLFPENWLFPELRDDKSSSFKQLESALGQGELTQDLANQAFGQFLDDVAQMGQIEVLGMYEDIALLDTGTIDFDGDGLPSFRTLYVVGRSVNPPYTYFWRHCVDFGSPYMVWFPWQQIELDIQGDHVLPFVVNRQLFIVWPLMTRSESDANGESTLEIKFNWSRYDGVRWHQPKTSRDEMALARAERFDERQGVHLEGFVTKQQQEDGEIHHDVAVWNVFTKSKYELQTSMPTERKVIVTGLFTAFLASSRYTKITKRNRSLHHVKINTIPLHADNPPAPTGSAQLIVTWSCWIKIKQYHSDPQPKYLELAPSTKREIVLDAAEYPFAPCQLGTVGRFLCVNAYYEAIDNLQEVAVSGTLPTGNWQVNAKFNGSKVGVLLSSDSIVTPNVVSGKNTTVTCVFEINASDYTIAELGLEDLVPSKFEPRGSFEIGADEVLRSSPQQIHLIAPTSTECRMNGFIELPGSGTSAFTTKLPPSSSVAAFQVLGASAPGLLYEGVPAISIHQVELGVDAVLLPRIWHYREGQSSAYIDVAHGILGRATKFCLYPAGFSEAVNYCTTWRYSNTISTTENQGGLFDAHLLPLQIVGMDRATIRLDGASSDINKTEQRKLSFDTQFPYACYNWEVFFHAPLLIADQLSKQHKFEDAERWLRYVFDPTSTESGTNAKRFLKFRVFNELNLNQKVIDDLAVLAQVAGGFGTPSDDDAVKKLINRWRNAPFRPFQIARGRHIAFLWRTLFAYLDNLIAWADSLYRRDTRESINEATMLYVLAERILGRRPQLHESKSNRPALNYEERITKWDDFANYWNDVGTHVSSNRPTAWREKDSIKQPNPDGMLYFCMPFNDKILSYWNVVEARLANVRNCRNIEGIKRSLPLMDAVIDPELLIRATAAGLNLSDVVSGLYAPPPHYRYSILSARAAELANEAKSLGAAMLSAMEKRDAEHLAQLRSSNEISLLKLVSEVRKLQITEAERNIEALRGSRKTVESRYNQYQRLLGEKEIKAPQEQESAGEESMLGRVDGGASGLSNLGLIDAENKHIEDLDVAYGWTVAGGIIKGLAGASHMTAGIVRAAIPPIPMPPSDPGLVPTAVLTAVGAGLSTMGDMFELVSRGWQHSANRQSILGGHLRRRDDWAFQSNQTLKELQQIDKQILANQIHIDITKKELDNHVEQIEQAKAVDEVMRSKFSNEQLYEWMRTQLYSLYSSAYRMALEMARRAERAAARELGVKPLNILRNDYWDSLRDGLLAGERLHQDIKRLEVTYLDQNRREFELTKHVSLRRLDPEKLVKLRVAETETIGGKKYNYCEFDIPEWLFDLDTPGHFMRRIKSVSVSIPSVIGPYTSVNCKLTLLKSSVRHDSAARDYLRQGTGDHPKFTDYFGASDAIVTSTGSGDSGLFETQLRDERFLPFEGAGVISTWRLELPGEYPQFDYSTISDVILTIRYTARDGGDSLRDAATASIASRMTPTQPENNEPLSFPVVLSCRSDFPTEWARAGANSPLEIQIPKNFLPYWMEVADLGVLGVQAVFDLIKETPTSIIELHELNSQDLPTIDGLTQQGFWEADFGPVEANVVDRVVLLKVGKS